MGCTAGVMAAGRDGAGSSRPHQFVGGIRHEHGQSLGGQAFATAAGLGNHDLRCVGTSKGSDEPRGPALERPHGRSGAEEGCVGLASPRTHTLSARGGGHPNSSTPHPAILLPHRALPRHVLMHSGQHGMTTELERPPTSTSTAFSSSRSFQNRLTSPTMPGGEAHRPVFGARMACSNRIHASLKQSVLQAAPITRAAGVSDPGPPPHLNPRRKKWPHSRGRTARIDSPPP